MRNGLHLVPRRQPQEEQTSESFLTEAVEFWEERYDRKMSREDARQITENLAGFFGVLEGWQTAEAAAGLTAEIRHNKAA
jgi:hypothetical protein